MTAPAPAPPTQSGGPGARSSAASGPGAGETHGSGFELYDLRVEVVGPADRPIYCGAKPGDYFELHGEMLKLPPGQGFSIYSLAALLPLLPAKQRVTDPNDWMSSDAEVACPDPNCPTRFQITRTGRRYFKRTDVTAVPLPARGPEGLTPGSSGRGLGPP
jgi:uncharacterized repeat protein (TIGR04076 family)